MFNTAKSNTCKICRSVPANSKNLSHPFIQNRTIDSDLTPAINSMNLGLFNNGLGGGWDDNDNGGANQSTDQNMADNGTTSSDWGAHNDQTFSNDTTTSVAAHNNWTTNQATGNNTTTANVSNTNWATGNDTTTADVSDTNWATSNDTPTSPTNNNESQSVQDLDLVGDQDTDSTKRRHSAQSHSATNKKQKPNGKHGGGLKGWSST